MSPSLITFLFEAANFVLLVGLLSWLFFKPVRKALDARRAAEEKSAKEAAARLAAAEDLQQRMNREHERLAAEIEETRSSLLLEAKRQADAMLQEGRAKMAQERERLERDLEALREAQAERLVAAVGAATREVLLRFLDQVDAPSIDAALVGRACRELEALEEPVYSATIESATSLDSKSRSALETALGGKSVKVEFRVVEELGAGVRISTPRGLIDASWVGLANHARRALVLELRDDVKKPPVVG